MSLYLIFKQHQCLQAAQGPVLNADRSADRWRWVLDGGQPSAQNHAPEGASDLLFTGHKDGRVRVWDLECSVPHLLLTVPFDAGGAGTKLRQVTALEVPSFPLPVPSVGQRRHAE